MAGQRLASLDAFRGLVIAGMILVNCQGSSDAAYAPLRHTEWSGWSVADLVAPAFLWIIGVAMAFSFRARAARGDSRMVLLRHAAGRATLLFLAGLCLHLLPCLLAGSSAECLQDSDILGVLQRIALAYLLAAVAALGLERQRLPLVIFLILLAYGAALLLLSAPGMAADSQGKAGNFIYYFDQLVLGRASTSHAILSVIPATALVLLGTHTGHFLLARAPRRAARLLLLHAVLLLLAGGGLSSVLALNRQILSPSFVLFAAGMSSLVLLALFWLQDIEGRRCCTTPLVALGTNPIVVYILSEAILALAHVKGVDGADGSWTPLWDFAWQWLATLAGSQQLASLLMACASLLVLTLLAMWLRRKRVLIKL